MKTIAAIVLTLISAAAQAQTPGVTADRILIGQTAGFTGPVAGGVKETVAGAQLYLNSVNKKGGVHGRRIEILSMDDGFEPKRAAANAKVLIEDKGVFALFLCRGTPHAEAVMPLLAQHGVPNIAPSTGAQLLHEPVNRYIYNVRSKYQDEAEKGIVQLSAMGTQKIAIVHVDDSFGRDGLAGAMKGFADAGLKPVGVYLYDRSGKVDEAVRQLLAAKPQAAMLIGSGAAVADIVARVRKADSFMQIVTLSNNASSAFVKSLGPNARGVIVTQVFPNPKMATTAISAEMQRLARGEPNAIVSHQSMEGFAAAKVLVEGLQRAGRKLTRESFMTALDNLHGFDLGGLKVDYSPRDHTGTQYVELSMIGKNGEFVQR